MIKKHKEIKNVEYEKHYMYAAQYQIIWCTEYKEPIFDTQTLVKEMDQILQNIALDNKIKIETLEIKTDYINLIISFRPSKSISSVVKTLKGRSAFLFLKKHPEIKKSRLTGHLWSPSYYFSTVGNISKSAISNYFNDPIYNATKN